MNGDLIFKRAFAAAIDFIVVGVILTIIGVVAYSHSGGHVRIWKSMWGVETCRASVCSSEIFGQEVDLLRVVRGERFEELTASTKPGLSAGGVARVTTIAVEPIDANGARVRPFYTNWIGGALAIFSFSILEWCFGFTVGSRIAGFKVVSQNGWRVRFVSVVVRNVLLWGWWEIGGLIGSAPTYILSGIALDSTFDLVGPAVGLVWVLIVALLVSLSPAQSLIEAASGLAIVQLRKGREGSLSNS